MSRENVETVRRCLTALSDAKPAEIELVVAEFLDDHPDYYPVRKFPDAAPRHGRDEVSRWLTHYRESWSSYEHTIQRLFAVGDDRVLAHVTLDAEGHESRVRLEGDIYYCLWLRNGRVLRWEDHLTLEGALRALGLRAETLEAAGLRE